MKKLSSVLLMVFGIGNLTYAQVTKSNTTPGFVNESQESRTITFTAIDLGGCTSMSDVDVSINWEGGVDPIMEDFAMRITSPAGTSVDLVYDIWGAFDPSAPNSTYENPDMDDFGPLITTFDDEAAAPAEGTIVPAAGTWQPQEPLSAFDGEDGTGTWTIEFSDDLDNGWGDEISWTQIDITISCAPPCTDPDVPTVTYSPATVCDGGTATLDWTGANLNDATQWHIYTGSCGGTLVGTTATNSYVVTPSAPNTTYYVRGEDGAGCVDESTGTCGSVTVTVTALDDASFNYSSATYCPSGSNPTPTITGLGGGTFSSTAGLSITPSTGEIDLAGSTNGTYTVTYTTSGTCPNSSNTDITIEDVTNPVITCPGNQSENADASCQVTLPDYTSLVTVTDDCDASPTLVQSPAPGTLISSTTTITMTATDATGNSSDCTFDVAINDATAPTASCQNISLYLDATGNASIVASDIDGGSTDNCGAVTLSPSQTAFTCAELGANNVTLTVTDGNSNTASCVAIVTVLDTISPTAVCQNINAYLDGAGNASIVAADIDGGSTDNCSTVSLGASQTAFTCADIGANSVTLTVTDGSANTANCVSTVTILDTVSPSVSCQNITLYLDGAGTASFVAADIDGGSTDNCGTVTLAASTTSFGCADVGANNVTLTATDDSGNSSNCTAVVTVLDTISPTATCQNITAYLDATGSISVNANDVNNGSTDNCSGMGYALSQSVFTCADIGANNVDLTITDPSGNASVCSLVVTIADSTAPALTCPIDQSSCDTTLADYTGTVTSTDNCSTPTITQSPAAGTILAPGTHVITITSTDDSGNSSDCTFNLAINPIFNEVDSTSICSGDSYVFGTQTLTTGGTYTEVFTSAGGCDSTVVLTLTEYPTYNETTSASICVGSTYTLGTQTLTTAGTYTEVFSTVNGCDSTVVLTLTVTTSVSYTDSTTICEGSSYSFGTQTLDTAGVYTEVFPLPSGCDSIVTLTLFVAEEYNVSISHIMCEGDSYQFGGQTLTESGNYGTIYQSIYGCDSTVNLTLIIGAENIDVIQDGPELIADNANATYQWVDCDNNYQPLPDDTNQVFVATTNGNYAVIIYEGGCSDTSACYSVNDVSTVELLLENQIKLYPNPARDQFNIEIDESLQGVEFNLYDISGKQLFVNQQILTGSTRIDVSLFERGVYFAEFRHGEKRQVIKLIVE